MPQSYEDELRQQVKKLLVRFWDSRLQTIIKHGEIQDVDVEVITDQLVALIAQQKREAVEQVVSYIRKNHQQKLMGLPTTSDIPFSPMYELTEPDLEKMLAELQSSSGEGE